MILDVAKLNLSFGGKRVLNDFGFTLEEGKPPACSGIRAAAKPPPCAALPVLKPPLRAASR
uniref:Uncharacterized protein n=1 Tax=Conchiformibius kuhniae TaxID=211502 RepID=A0A8T9MYF7_9NEIS|nr:hypothetical protein LVJ77_05185 [Conchiformibius kuhniae]